MWRKNYNLVFVAAVLTMIGEPFVVSVKESAGVP